jgi:hypothetical protein
MNNFCVLDLVVHKVLNNEGIATNNVTERNVLRLREYTVDALPL